MSFERLMCVQFNLQFFQIIGNIYKPLNLMISAKIRRYNDLSKFGQVLSSSHHCCYKTDYHRSKSKAGKGSTFEIWIVSE